MQKDSPVVLTRMLYAQSGDTVNIDEACLLKGFIMSASANLGVVSLKLNDVTLMNYASSANPSFITFIPFERTLAVGDRIYYESSVSFSTLNLLVELVSAE